MARTWLDNFTKNHADLSDDEPDLKLRPLVLSRTPDEAVRAVAEILTGLPRWQVKSTDGAAGTIHAVHITLLWRFRDDLHIRFEPMENGSKLFAHSQARLGKADFGKNAANLRELTEAVRRRLG